MPYYNTQLNDEEFMQEYGGAGNTQLMGDFVDFMKSQAGNAYDSVMDFRERNLDYARNQDRQAYRDIPMFQDGMTEEDYVRNAETARNMSEFAAAPVNYMKGVPTTAEMLNGIRIADRNPAYATVGLGEAPKTSLTENLMDSYRKAKDLAKNYYDKEGNWLTDFNRGAHEKFLENPFRIPSHVDNEEQYQYMVDNLLNMPEDVAWQTRMGWLDNARNRLKKHPEELDKFAEELFNLGIKETYGGPNNSELLFQDWATNGKKWNQLAEMYGGGANDLGEWKRFYGKSGQKNLDQNMLLSIRNKLLEAAGRKNLTSADLMDDIWHKSDEWRSYSQWADSFIPRWKATHEALGNTNGIIRDEWLGTAKDIVALNDYYERRKLLGSMFDKIMTNPESSLLVEGMNRKGTTSENLMDSFFNYNPDKIETYNQLKKELPPYVPKDLYALSNSDYKYLSNQIAKFNEANGTNIELGIRPPQTKAQMDAYENLYSGKGLARPTAPPFVKYSELNYDMTNPMNQLTKEEFRFARHKQGEIQKMMENKRKARSAYNAEVREQQAAQKKAEEEAIKNRIAENEQMDIQKQAKADDAVIQQYRSVLGNEREVKKLGLLNATPEQLRNFAKKESASTKPKVARVVEAINKLDELGQLGNLGKRGR